MSGRRWADPIPYAWRRCPTRRGFQPTMAGWVRWARDGGRLRSLRPPNIPDDRSVDRSRSRKRWLGSASECSRSPALFNGSVVRLTKTGIIRGRAETPKALRRLQTTVFASERFGRGTIGNIRAVSRLAQRPVQPLPLYTAPINPVEYRQADDHGQAKIMVRRNPPGHVGSGVFDRVKVAKR